MNQSGGLTHLSSGWATNPRLPQLIICTFAGMPSDNHKKCHEPAAQEGGGVIRTCPGLLPHRHSTSNANSFILNTLTLCTVTLIICIIPNLNYIDILYTSLLYPFVFYSIFFSTVYLCVLQVHSILGLIINLLCSCFTQHYILERENKHLILNQVEKELNRNTKHKLLKALVSQKKLVLCHELTFKVVWLTLAFSFFPLSPLLLLDPGLRPLALLPRPCPLLGAGWAAGGSPTSSSLGSSSRGRIGSAGSAVAPSSRWLSRLSAIDRGK